MNLIHITLLTLATTCSGQSTSTPNETTPKPPTAKICVHESIRRVRTFPTLQEYQSNKQSFDVKDSSYAGNIVNFTFSAIYSLSTNDFISYGSESIVEMNLHGKEIKSIAPKTFNSLTCLSKLDLSYNNLTELTEGSFEGVENLKELNLSHNKLIDIPDSGMAFFVLKNLVVLDLSHNRIKALSKLSFMMLYNLEFLDIGHNKIKTIDERVFNYLSSLKELRLNDNLMVEPFAYKWKGLENLTNLDLSDNYLTSFDTSANYSFYNLKRMNLSGNNLQFLNVYWIRKNFPKLQNLDLANNSWFCEDLESIKHGIVDLRITIPREVGCSEIKTSSIKTSTTTTTPTTPVLVTSTSGNKINYNVLDKELLEQNKRIIISNNEIIDAVNSLKTWIVFVIIVVIAGVTVEVGLRRGWFESWSNTLRGRSNRGYLDSNDVESVGLISR